MIDRDHLVPGTQVKMGAMLDQLDAEVEGHNGQSIAAWVVAEHERIVTARKTARERVVTIHGVELHVGRWYELVVRHGRTGQQAWRVVRYLGLATSWQGKDEFRFERFPAAALKNPEALTLWRRPNAEVLSETNLVSVAEIAEPTIILDRLAAIVAEKAEQERRWDANKAERLAARHADLVATADEQAMESS
jgi:hypothetical protein